MYVFGGDIEIDCCWDAHYIWILCQIYYIILLRKITLLPPNLATAGGLTARFPAVARSLCSRNIIWVDLQNKKARTMTDVMDINIQMDFIFNNVSLNQKVIKRWCAVFFDNLNMNIYVIFRNQIQYENN